MLRKIEESIGSVNSDLERKITETFDTFDHAGNKTIDVRDAGTILRALGCCPTQAEVQEFIVKTEDAANPGIAHISKFLPLALQAITEQRFQPATPDKLLEAFHVLDENCKGYLEINYISTLVTQEGEPFNEDELEQMFEAALDFHTKTLPYEYYINQLMVTK